ncbi:GspH/FimT family pseudopilin [Aquabacterium sp.]|uniref:GspH/FimT family pseudopilin n=1 Tax=Aquabacterium sp. TaxID=1872578 RepID=UPI0019BA6A91|nr:GspH/FimT family pseudopilin [Aquabacterium sp.]MBC7700179.1 GspH/FimT family pseudopilin [Aquabacterium sp.]
MLGILTASHPLGAPAVTRHRATGFTLIELMVTVVLLAILAALAAPSFREFIANQRVKNAAFELMAALTQTRSEAITRNASVDLLRSGTTWGSGWTILAGTSTVLNQEAYNGLSITDSADLNKISYGKDGRSTTTSTKFTLTSASAMSGVSPRCVSIGLSGVPSNRLGAC